MVNKLTNIIVSRLLLIIYYIGIITLKIKLRFSPTVIKGEKVIYCKNEKNGTDQNFDPVFRKLL